MKMNRSRRVAGLAVVLCLVAAIPPSVGGNTDDATGDSDTLTLVKTTEIYDGLICVYVTGLIYVATGCPGAGGNGFDFNLTDNVTRWRVEVEPAENSGSLRYVSMADPSHRVRYQNRTDQPLPAPTYVLEDGGRHWREIRDLFGTGEWSVGLFPWLAANMAWTATVEKWCAVDTTPPSGCGLPPDASWTVVGTYDPPSPPAPEGPQGFQDDMETLPGGWTTEDKSISLNVVGPVDPWPPSETVEWHPYRGDAHSGEQSWRVGIEELEAYPAMAHATLVSPLIQMRDRSDASLSVWIKGSATDSDLLLVMARPANSTGLQWKVYDTIRGDVPDWTRFDYDLSVFAGQDLQVGFYFRAATTCVASPALGELSPCGRATAGYLIDDVVVG